jgi:hypothetical protein
MRASRDAAQRQFTVQNARGLMHSTYALLNAAHEIRYRMSIAGFFESFNTRFDRAL